MRTTVKQLIAALGEYPADAVVLVPDFPLGRVRDLLLAGREIMEVDAKRIVRSRVLPVRRGSRQLGARTRRIRFTEYEVRRYGDKIQPASEFPVKAVYLNIADE